MRIACIEGGRFSDYTGGLTRAFSVAGNDCKLWNPLQNTVEAAYEDVQPELLILDSDFVTNNDACKSLNSMKCKKVVVGDMINRSLDYDLFCCTTNKDLKWLPSVYNFQMAADVAGHNKSIFKEELKCDIAVLGKTVDGLQVEIDRLTYPNVSGMKIFTDVHTYHIEYVGKLEGTDRSDIFASTKFVLTNDLQTLYNAAYHGTYVLYQRANPFFPPFGDGNLCLANILNSIDSRSAASRKKYENAGRAASRLVIDGQTYFHRCADILRLLNLTPFDPNRLISRIR